MKKELDSCGASNMRNSLSSVIDTNTNNNLIVDVVVYGADTMEGLKTRI